MKAIILVLSARRSPWGELMDTSRQTWDAEYHPQARTLYYCGASSEHSTPSVFYSAFSEDLCDVSTRTIEAFERALSIPGWDFIARPNSSCYVHKKNLVAYLETLPQENVLHGLLAFEGTGIGHQLLWGGGGYIMSRDVVARMVEHKSEWRKELMEDESITRLAERIGIPFGRGRAVSINQQPDGSWFCLVYGPGDSFTFTDFADVREKAPGHFFFRLKQDEDRTKDVRIMHELKKHLP